MKKYIALSLSIITMMVGGWLIVNRLPFLDIPSNKNDYYAHWEKQKVYKRTDIDECDKKILINQIDLKRKNEKMISGVAFQTQVVAFVIIIIQLILFVLILLMPKKASKKQL